MTKIIGGEVCKKKGYITNMFLLRNLFSLYPDTFELVLKTSLGNTISCLHFEYNFPIYRYDKIAFLKRQEFVKCNDISCAETTLYVKWLQC